ncbi:MAG: HTH-type transcriptional regulator / antitoxin HigA [Mucilaginibacter sp.]|nr:HTH-type transcriptional regulator / antitoxin HigA [Mucilaginibacter sp.]
MLKRIETEAEYDDALKRVYELMQTNIKKDSANLDELEVLSLLVEKFEQAHYPVIYSHTSSIDNSEFK